MTRYLSSAARQVRFTVPDGNIVLHLSSIITHSETKDMWPGRHKIRHAVYNPTGRGDSYVTNVVKFK